MDFGLAKPWLDERSGAPLPQRATAAFRGSTTYASSEWGGHREVCVCHIQRRPASRERGSVPDRSCRRPAAATAANCHQLQDQSRRDDLWGWFYCLVELVEGESSRITCVDSPGTPSTAVPL